MRILVTRVGAVGDTLLLSPLLQNLRLHYAAPEIHALGHPERVGLLLARPNADKVLSSEDSRWLGLHRSGPQNSEAIEWLSGYDLALCFSSESEGTLGRNLRNILGDRLLKHPALPPDNYQKHYVEFLLEPLAGRGCPARILFPVLPDVVGAQERPPIGPTDEFFVIHPGAGSRAKRRPLEQFISLGKKLTEKTGSRCHYLLGPADTDLQIDLAQAGCEVLPPLSLDQVVALLRRARGYAGNDSGITHLAAALGIPTVAFFTATEPLVWSPLGPRVKVFDVRGKAEAAETTPAATCFMSEHVHRQDPTEEQ